MCVVWANATAAETEPVSNAPIREIVNLQSKDGEPAPAINDGTVMQARSLSVIRGGRMIDSRNDNRRCPRCGASVLKGQRCCGQIVT